MRKLIFIFAALILSGFAILCDRGAIPDTRENRVGAAKSYLKIVPMENILEDIATKRALELPQNRREEFKNLIKREVRLEVVERATITALTKHFTAAEIEALAGFYGSPRGQSIINKFASYAAEVMPPIQEEVRRAMSLSDIAKTQLHWSNQIQEFKAKMTDENIVADYEFTNLGPRAVTIKSVRASCGCTTARLDKKVYQPGERGKLTAIFNIDGRRGHHSNMIAVVTDEPNEPTIFLELRVEILELLRITPRFVFWEAKEKIKPKTIQLSVLGDYDVEISGMESIPELFEAKLVRDGPNGMGKIHITPKTTSNPINGKLFIHAVIGSNTMLRFPVFLRIIPSKKDKIEKADTSSWGDVMWIDARSQADYNEPFVPGAILLNEDEWDSRMESVIAQWTPGTRIVVYSPHGSLSYRVVQRLGEYGLENIYIIVPSE